MTRRITCYVVFVTLIWGAHTQNEEKTRDNMFKSNMTRNDFSKLLSSLIKLNEQRVSVLQKLYKLEDYGVLSEVLRTGDSKPETGKGNPNNLFLIVMSKKKTDPSRRNIDYEIVDSVTSLDVGSKKVHPKLNYVLDPAGYFSQNTQKENSIETMFENIPKVHRPKNTLLIDDESKENAIGKKKLKQQKPAQRTAMSSNILRVKNAILKAKKEIKNRNKQSISSHYPEIFVTKVISMEDAISKNNHKYKDREDEHDHSSPFSKEYVEDTTNRNKHTVTKTAIKATTSKNNLRITSTVNSDNIDTFSKNNQNHKNSEEKEDENDYDSPFSKEYVENIPNHKYTKIDSNTSIKKKQVNKHTTLKTAINHTIKNKLRIISTVNTDKINTLANNNQNDKLPLKGKDLEDENYYGSPFSKEYDESGPNRQITKIDDYNPKIILQDKQDLNLNRSKSIMEQDTTYSKTDLTTTTAKYNIKSVSTVKHYKVSEDNQTINNPNLYVKIKGKHLSKEKEKIPTLSNKNASGSEISETTKDLPFENQTNKENSGIATDLPDEVEYKDEEPENNTNHGIENPSPLIMFRETVDVKTTLPIKTDSSSLLKDVTENSNKTNKENSGIAKDSPDEVEYEDAQPENNTNHGVENRSPPIIVSENVDVKVTLPVKTDSPSHLEDVSENSNKDKPKAAKDLRIENKSSAKADRDFIIDQKEGNEFSIIVTHMGKEKPEEIKQHDNVVVNPKEFDQPEGKPIARKGFQKCLNKKAKKLCCKSCISAYKNVCTRLKCTSKAKKALKKECKKSCEKTFKSSSSKYSDEDSYDSGSDDTGSDSSDSDSS